jgi:hypothetical protein
LYHSFWEHRLLAKTSNYLAHNTEGSDGIQITEAISKAESQDAITLRG